MKKILLFTCLHGMLLSSTLSQKNYFSVIDKYMQAQVAVNDFSGVVLVAVKSKIIYKKAFGYADREWQIPNTLQAKFEIGSLTKQFTAAAILQLAAQQKINLSDKLNIYFPGYPKGDSVTLHMLLNHTSGIADYTSLPNFYPLHTLPLEKDSVVALFKNQPYTFSPGTNWRYSNSNYFLLGYIIEKVTKQPYASYLYENIIKKASLQNTNVNRIDSVLALRARGYSRSETGGWKNADYFSMEFPYSAGSVISTAEDLYHWQNALLNAKVISIDMLKKMITPYLNGYSYGLFVDSFQHHLRISHAGAIPGFTSYMSAFPADSISIIVLSNNDGNSSAVANEITNALFNLPVELPYKVMEKAINAAVLKRYVGKYQLGGTTNFELMEKGSSLYLKPEGGGEMQLKSASETLFFFAGNTEQQIEFVVDKKGTVTKCNFINKGSRMEIKKLD